MKRPFLRIWCPIPRNCRCVALCLFCHSLLIASIAFTPSRGLMWPSRPITISTSPSLSSITTAAVCSPRFAPSTRPPWLPCPPRSSRCATYLPGVVSICSDGRDLSSLETPMTPSSNPSYLCPHPLLSLLCLLCLLSLLSLLSLRNRRRRRWWCELGQSS